MSIARRHRVALQVLAAVAVTLGACARPIPVTSTSPTTPNAPITTTYGAQSANRYDPIMWKPVIITSMVAGAGRVRRGGLSILGGMLTSQLGIGGTTW